MRKRVTKIQVQRRHPNRRSLFLDGDFFCGVDEEVLLRLSLEEGMEVDEGEIAQILLTEEKLRAKRDALRLLSYRMRSKNELNNRLMRKGFTNETIQDVICDLEEVGLVDDLEFAKSWIRTRMELNPRSFYALENELRLKGVDREVARLALNELKGDYDEKAIALELARKRLHSLKGKDQRESRRRLMGFLSRRGYRFEIAKSVIDELEGK